MKKIILPLIAIILACAAFAQAPAPASAPSVPLPSFEVYLGGGQVAVASSGNAVAYDVNFETNAFVGFRYFPTSKFAIDATYTHDSVSIAYWLARHDFTEPSSDRAYQYSALAVSAEYWLLRNGHGGLYAFVGPNYFIGTGGQDNKLGLSAGIGAQYALGRFFLESRAEYWHVQQFLVPVANTYVGRIAVGFKF